MYKKILTKFMILMTFSVDILVIANVETLYLILPKNLYIEKQD